MVFLAKGSFNLNPNLLLSLSFSEENTRLMFKKTAKYSVGSARGRV